MTRSRTDWDHWRTFIAVLEHGSLSKAARKLSISQPTASRHIDFLEQAVGAALFSRSRDGLSPTELASNLLDDARAMEAAANSLERIISRNDERIAGTVRLTASEIIGTQFLLEPLSSLQKMEPLLKVELVLSNTQDDMLNREADLAIRLVRPKQKQLITQKIGSLELGLFAHKSYLENQAPPQTAKDLHNYRLIGIDRNTEQWANVMIGDQSAAQLDLDFRCDSDIGQLLALKAGLGIGICPARIAALDKDLVPLLEAEFSLSYEVWLTMHEDLKRDRAVRVVRNHLVSALGQLLEVPS